MTAIQGVLHHRADLSVIAPQTRENTVKAIALSCLKEFVVTLTLTITVACFVPTPTGIAYLITATFVQLAASIFFHSLGAYAQSQISQKKPFEKILNICEWVTGANFALFTGFNTQMLIHETGHSLAALFSYKRPQPKIELHPFIGGITQFYKTSLSGFGKKIGPVATTCFVIASGPAFTLLISAVLLAIGLAVKEKHPQLGKYLITWGLLDFINHANYAYSALRAEPSNFTHDFVHLSIFGLHPVVATIGIIAIPIVITLASNWLQPSTITPQNRPAADTSAAG